MKTFAEFTTNTKRDIIAKGLTPRPAVTDIHGNCVYCGEAGRCPGWHTPTEVAKAKGWYVGQEADGCA